MEDEDQPIPGEFAMEYAGVYHHGAPGHLDMMIISKLRDCLVNAVTLLEDARQAS